MSELRTTSQWILQESGGGVQALELQEPSPIPELDSHDVLVELRYASLNYRDISMTQTSEKGTYPFPVRNGVVPGSDGAGTVLAIGKAVTRFRVGDTVCTQYNPGHQSGLITLPAMETGLGSKIDGTLRKAGIFDEWTLVHMPESLDFRYACTLSCAAVTAWNALFGLEGRRLAPGQTVLTQGSGGVSVFAIQFAKMVGARVIATTSSEEKAKKLQALGADEVLNYRTDPDWGESAKALTPKMEGVEHVVEVGGPQTFAQSLKAIKIEGVISAIGFLSGLSKPQPSFVEQRKHYCTIRTLSGGSRVMFEEMNSAISVNKITPIIDDREFSFEQVKEAYQYLMDQKHFGKVTIKIS